MEKVKYRRRLKAACLFAWKFYDICDLQYLSQNVGSIEPQGRAYGISKLLLYFSLHPKVEEWCEPTPPPPQMTSN